MACMNPNHIIDALGGNVPVARIFDITDAAVSQWRKNGIPKPNLMYLESKYSKVFKQLKQKDTTAA